MLGKCSFFNLIQNYLKEKLNLAEGKLKINVNFNDRGDFTLPLFEISKKQNKEMDSVARDIQDFFKNERYVTTSYENGFLDFYLDPVYVMTKYLSKDSRLQDTESKRRDFNLESSNLQSSIKKVVFEFSSPNIAKPFTIGHLRSTNIGSALSNIFEYTGDTVVRLNYLGDWGTQFGKLLYAYKNYFDKQKPLDLYTLNALYVRFHTEQEKNKDLETIAQNIFKDLENGDRELHNLWERFYSISINYFNGIYKKLNVRFDDIESESLYIQEAKSLTRELLQKGIAKISQDATIVDLEDEKMGVVILQKKDESTIYFSRDLSAILSRFEKYKFDAMFYVVGKEQQLHFRQLYNVAEKIDGSLKGKLIHIPFGHFRFKGEKISTREGKVIYFEEVMNKGVEKVENILKNRAQNTEYRIQDIPEMAEKIAISALKYYDLKNHIIKDIDFSWDEALNFDGNTGPYILYGLVRIKSLFRKFNEKFRLAEPTVGGTQGIPTDTAVDPADFDSIDITRVAQQKQINYLLRKILLSYDFILLAKSTLEPNILCNYIFDLLKIFNNYYQNVKIITEDEKESLNNLCPFLLLRDVIRTYIKLLGLEEIEFM